MTKRVLVCEDDRGIRTFLDRFVSRRGVEVHTAVDGRECLEKLGRSDYDALLLDLMMPALDGYEVLQRLRESDAGILQRTIVLTASPVALKAPPSDVAGFFSKPFDLHALFEKLDSLLQTDRV